MKKLKKYSIFFLLLIGLTACSKEKIELPKSKDLESIKVTEIIKEKKEEQDIVNINKEEDINNFIDSVSSATKTKQSSISDTPTNVDKYFIISLNHKDSKNKDSKFYIYKSKKYSDDKYVYLEQPYRGIFRIKKEKLKDINWLND